MMNDIEQSLPEQWRGFFRVIVFPISWLPQFQTYLLHFAWSSDLLASAFLKRIFFVLPSLSVVAAFWCTMLAVYTLLFRWNRTQFIATLLVCWWDLARSIWIFWAGMGKFVFVVFGSSWGLLRLIVEVLMEVIREIFELPFALTGTLTRNFLQPGVPWIAFLMTVAWSAIEALVFTYILTPTISEILSDLVGAESHRFLGPFLFAMLLFMISGSFACMQVLVEAITQKNVKQIAQMLIVEFFVMFVEVVFLYRELVDALTPWIYQQTGVQLGLFPVLLFSVFGWIGIRGMIWFLFARFGTPTLLAIIARHRLPEEASVARAIQAVTEQKWETVIQKLKKEQDWFQERAQALLEAAILPAFHVIAAGLNFGIVLFLSQPIFTLPFKSLADVGDTRSLLQTVSQWRTSK